ncbi:MAG: GAF domain-containing protein [Chloroflexota bacterium]|nr:GAF domain-containing protein [Chloroflexota bacterium]
MTDLTPSTLDRARGDILNLRRGMSDLARWLTAQSADVSRAREIGKRIAVLGEFLERLNAGLEEQQKERTQLEGLFQVSRAVNSSLHLEQVLNRAMDIIIQVTHAERGFLMLTDDQGNLQVSIARNVDRETITSPTFEVSRSILEEVARTGQPIVTTDAQRDPRFSAQGSVVSLSLRSILCIPLKAKENVIGVVYVDNRLRAGMFQQADVSALGAFADQAAIAIENARLFESVDQKMQEIARLKTFQDNIFASIASGVMATDLEDRITAFNRAAEMIFAVPASKSIGRPYTETLAILASAPLTELVDKVKHATTRNAAAEIESNLPPRGTVNLSFNISSLKDARGNPQGITIVVDDVTEKRRLAATQAMFRRYVAPAVVDRLPDNPDLLKLGGHRQELTILFADIRGFTHFSEPLPPEELVDVLNAYLSIAADVILKHEGTLDKFMGDAVMAIFNAPLPQNEHALIAAKAALGMRAAVTHLHDRLPPPLRLHFGIGIHTGEAVVGNVGTEQQMNFTAIGDAVNLAKRLQENAKGGQILLSEQTYARVRQQVEAHALPSLKVKGRRAITEVWELVGLHV